MLLLTPISRFHVFLSRLGKTLKSIAMLWTLMPQGTERSGLFPSFRLGKTLKSIAIMWRRRGLRALAPPLFLCVLVNKRSDTDLVSPLFRLGKTLQSIAIMWTLMTQGTESSFPPPPF